MRALNLLEHLLNMDHLLRCFHTGYANSCKVKTKNKLLVTEWVSLGSFPIASRKIPILCFYHGVYKGSIMKQARIWCNANPLEEFKNVAFILPLLPNFYELEKLSIAKNLDSDSELLSALRECG